MERHLSLRKNFMNEREIVISVHKEYMPSVLTFMKSIKQLGVDIEKNVSFDFSDSGYYYPSKLDIEKMSKVYPDMFASFTKSFIQKVTGEEWYYSLVSNFIECGMFIYMTDDEFCTLKSRINRMTIEFEEGSKLDFIDHLCTSGLLCCVEHDHLYRILQYLSESNTIQSISTILHILKVCEDRNKIIVDTLDQSGVPPEVANIVLDFMNGDSYNIKKRYIYGYDSDSDTFFY